MAEYVDNGWLRAFPDVEALQRYLGAPPILNKFACITKTKVGEHGATTIKKRIIMDAKQSLVKEAANRQFRAILPRVTDAINDVIAVLNSLQEDQQAEQVVLDAKDAFWEVPLHPDERRFYCGRILDEEGNIRYVTYCRTAQGSRGAPLTWSAVNALISRLVLSLLYEEDAVSGDLQLHDRMNVYVDDPWAVLVGTQADRDRKLALLILGWRVLGINLALAKGQCAADVNWIGASLDIPDRKHVIVQIIKGRLDELHEMTIDILGKNYILKSVLRTYTGKAQSMASVIITWRPFVHMLYGAIYSDASNSQVWTKQIRIPLEWILAFLTMRAGNLRRSFDVDSHFRRGRKIEIVTDASPWGVGAFIIVDGKPRSWFSVRVADFDFDAMQLVDSADSKVQQALEAFCMLLALRTWHSQWSLVRSALTVKGDNMAALTMVIKLQPRSPTLSIIAREIALDVADALYCPTIVARIPGVVNRTADSLSRRYAPSAQNGWEVPDYLQNTMELIPKRDRTWWRSVEPLVHTA